MKRATGWLLVLPLLLGGCVESNLVAQTRWELENGIPGASFRKQHAMHFGRITTALVRPIAMWALRDDEDMQSLRGVRRIDVAVYEVVDFPEVVDGLMLADLEQRMNDQGWNRVIRTKEEEEVTWIFNRENKAGEIKDLFVVSMDGGEMVMVRVGGRVDRMLAEMIADDPGGFGASLGG